MSSDGDTRVAKRYASALFHAGRRLGKTEAVQSDLDGLVGLWETTPALRHAMESPLVPAERKRSLLDRSLQGRVDALTLSFLYLLVEKRREGILPEVRDEFMRQADVARGLIRAHAQVAVPVDDSQRAALVAGLQQRTGKHIELTIEVEPAVLGGVLVRMHDTVIDGSVRGALERIRERMLHE